MTKKELEERQDLIRDALNAQAENRLLKAKIKELESTIDYYRGLLENAENGSNTAVKQAINKRPVGAPVRIDDGTKNRIRKLKEQGYTYREISKKENVSLGKISKIMNEN